MKLLPIQAEVEQAQAQETTLRGILATKEQRTEELAVLQERAEQERQTSSEKEVRNQAETTFLRQRLSVLGFECLCTFRLLDRQQTCELL